METTDFEFDLPPDRVAVAPADARDDARLMVMDRRGVVRKHLRFREILDELPARSLLVLNDARVLAARLRGRKPTGGAVEFLLTQRMANDRVEPGDRTADSVNCGRAWRVAWAARRRLRRSKSVAA